MAGEKRVKAESHSSSGRGHRAFPFIRRPDELRASIRPFIGWEYTEPGASEALNANDWTDYYPEVDGLGELTGNIIDGDNDDYIVIDDTVMIEKYSLSAGELERLRGGEFPVWVTAPEGGLH
jgi:hypothetical protein